MKKGARERYSGDYLTPSSQVVIMMKKLEARMLRGENEWNVAAQFVRCWSNIPFEESLQHPTNNASTYKGFNGSIIQIQIMK